LTDGDAQTDTDGNANGEIADSGALAVSNSNNSSNDENNGSGGDSSCFILHRDRRRRISSHGFLFILLILGLVGINIYKVRHPGSP